MDALRNRLVLLIILLVLPALACNMPRGTPTPSEADALYTAAAQTVSAQLTQVTQPLPTTAGGTPGAPTAVPTFPVAPTSTQTSLPINTATTVPPTATQVPCDRIKFVKDVTYPDNTEVPAGTSFIKTWRLQNDGSCTWNTGYALVFTSGEAMGASASVPLTSSVGPGQTVDLSVSLVAPSDGGTYRGDYKLRNASNALFGLGNDNKPFFVQIKVPVATGLLFDFISRASEAEWSSGSGGGAGSPLSFGGADDDPNGVAKIKDQVKLETGATSGKILLTFPKHEANGWTSGMYPSYAVQRGDRLKGRLGFMMNPGDVCGAGDVTFKILYREGDTTRQLREWSKTCNGRFTSVDLDISDLRGKTVRFILRVESDGDFADDWAIWNSLRIEH